MIDDNTDPSGTSPPPLPATGSTLEAVSAFASAKMVSSDSNGAAAIDPAPAASTANVSPASDHECANCSNLAKQRCAGCVGGIDDYDGNESPLTYYCGKDCQREHWKTHQTECKLASDRKQLFRLARLVQWAFYASTKAMWSDGILDVEKVEEVDGVQLRVKRYLKHDLLDFPSFPESGFAGYGGMLEEGDEQAMLATSAPTGAIVCGLLDELVKACKSKIQVEEVTFHPVACPSVSFAPLDSTSPNQPENYWMFRATLLRDGSSFAFDPCNAQWMCTTIEERKCGLFHWGAYLQRLSMKSFEHPAGTDIQALRSHAPKSAVYPVSNIRDADKNIFVDTDVKSTAESMASSSLVIACATLYFKTKLSLKKLIARTSSDAEHAEDVKIFKAHVQEVIKRGRAKGIKDLLLERLHHKG